MSVIEVPGKSPISRRRMKAAPDLGNPRTIALAPIGRSDNFTSAGMSDPAPDQFDDDVVGGAAAQRDPRPAEVAHQGGLPGNLLDHRRLAKAHLPQPGADVH